MQHVASKIALLFFKLLIVFIALSQIISIVWYQESMSEYQSIGMLVSSLIAIFISISPLQNRIQSTLNMYILLCAVGIIVSISLAMNYLLSFSEPNWVGFIVNILVLIFFLLMGGIIYRANTAKE